MLVIDPRSRISVEEALKHPYVNLWYDPSEVDGPPPPNYDSSVEQQDHSVEDWKLLIYREIVAYESVHDIYGTGRVGRGAGADNGADVENDDDDEDGDVEFTDAVVDSSNP